ncbi:DUF4160 domain-containing protein [uncultured Cetobacterium sp.]|uniref:DUF4160 domain-containing protein n=1 Tax=uncultured Cetobacterium sp. TaxID=527638 RepID=UPI002630BF9E|nr:DUF4160 domain-containing protein [uncultured Cetobacterium sp.]
MPVIATFNEITIKMFFNDKLPPHFHALYGNSNALFDLNSLELIEGDLPDEIVDFIIEWSKTCRVKLMDMWINKVFIELP